MRGVRARLGEELRAKWRQTLGFALLIGLVAGVVLATVAGARRTETAYDRYLAEADAEDAVITQFGPSNPQFQQILDAFRALPEVEQMSVTAPILAVPDNTEIRFRDFEAGVDDQWVYGMDRPKLDAGRLPDPARAEEVLVNRAAAHALHLEVGDRLVLRTMTEDEYSAGGVADESVGTKRRFTVTGIGVLPNEVVPIAPFDGAAALVLTPAYLEAHPEESFDYSYLHTRLRHGAAGVQRFRAEIAGALQDMGIPVQYVPFIDAGARQAKVNRSIRPQAQALLLFGVMLAVVGFLVLGQLLSRHLLLEEADRRRLWAVGFTRGQLLLVALLRVSVVLAGASIVAVVVAVVASDRFPIGPARIAEPHPGTEANVAVLGAGIGVLLLLFLVGTGFSVARSLPRFGTSVGATVPAHRSRPSRVASTLSEAGAPPPAVVGVRMALERGRGATAVPVIGALVATALALGALTASVTFGVNLQRLVSTPSLYGLEWDLGVGNGFVEMPLAASRRVLDGDPDVDAWSVANLGELSLRAAGDPAGGRAVSVPAVGISTLGSDVYPRLIRGRPVRQRDEIVVGEGTAGQLGVDVGDHVATTDQTGQPVTLEVVGVAVFPGMGRAIFDSTDLDTGAAVRNALLTDGTTSSPLHSTYLVRYRDGVDPAAAGERLRTQFLDLGINSDCQFSLCIVTDYTPAGIRNYDRVRSTPLVLSGVLALLAVATLAITLATSVRRRRRDFAVLESLGFVRRQVAATTAWQATTVALVALVLGLPLGVAGGRALWTLFSDDIGVSVPAVTPTLFLVLVAPVTIVLANVIAFIPGRLAARTNAARVLRSE